MITDEQVDLATNAMTDYEDKMFDGIGSVTVNDAVRVALETYEQSKWVKFDVDDKSTFPPIDKDSDYLSIPVNTSTGFTVRFSYIAYEWLTEDGCFVDERISYENLYWQPLPEFKE